MYYAVCWLNENRRIGAWTIHPDVKTAKEIKSENIEGNSFPIDKVQQVYKVDVTKDELEFEEEMFMSILTHGYGYFEEPNPRWLRGSSCTNSKVV